VGESLPLPLRGSNMGFTNQSYGPEGLYLGKMG
jgi:hypothetical protein